MKKYIKYIKYIGIIYEIRKYLDKQTLRNMYFSFIYPYSIKFFSGCGNTHDTH